RGAYPPALDQLLCQKGSWSLVPGRHVRALRSRGLYHPNRSEPALKRKARRSATSLPHLAEREFFALHLSAHCARRPDRAWRVSRDRCLTRTLFDIQRSLRYSVPLLVELILHCLASVIM